MTSDPTLTEIAYPERIGRQRRLGAALSKTSFLRGDFGLSRLGCVREYTKHDRPQNRTERASGVG